MSRKKSIIALAMESVAEGSEKNMVVMDGPLGTIMAKALDVAYARTDPLTGESTMADEAKVTAESHAIDYILNAQQSAQAQFDGDGQPEDKVSSVKVHSYGVGQVIHDGPSHVEVFEQLKDMVPMTGADVVMVTKVSDNPNAPPMVGSFSGDNNRMERNDVVIISGTSRKNLTVESIAIVVTCREVPDQS